MLMAMQNPTKNAPELEEEKTSLLLWKESVGKVFKLTSKSYGIRTVVYTLIKAVKETENPAEFYIEVCCAEITARVLDGKRAHSSACTQGIIHQDDQSILTPRSFGEECRLQEYEKIAAAILTHATSSLDLVTQRDSEEKTEIEVPIDFPHLKLTDMEASLLRHSPFLLRDVYLLSPNSRRAGLESINHDLHRAARNTRLTDTCDPIYVAQKNAAVTSLRAKLTAVAAEATGPKNSAAPGKAPGPTLVLQRRDKPAPAEQKVTSVANGVEQLPQVDNRPRVAAEISPKAPLPATQTKDPIQMPNANGHTVGKQGAKSGAPADRRSELTALEKRNNISLALHAKASEAYLSWERQNPSKEGPVFRIGKESGLLEFVHWAHVSGRSVSFKEAAGKNIRAYFGGPESSYTGPDYEGIYPLLQLESEAQDSAALSA